jgi:hypothetical protein
LMAPEGANVRARIDLLAAEAGGLKVPLPPGTRSLMLTFDGERVMAGASITPVDGEPLIPGKREIEVGLTFWDHRARELVERKGVFNLWYGRVVGQGRVIGAP